MRTVVCIKAVPSVVLGTRITDTGDGLDFQTRSIVMNESDEYALEEALVLRTRCGGQVTAIGMGLPSCEDVLRTAIAKGADQAMRVDAGYFDAERTSLLLAKAIQKMGYDLILAGMESLDNMGSQVAVSVASRLGIPFVFGATEITPMESEQLKVTKELGGGCSAVLEVKLPALVCIQPGIRRLSYVPFAKVVQARRKSIDCIKIGDLGLSSEGLAQLHRMKIIETFKPKHIHTGVTLSGNSSEIAEKVTEIIRRAR